MYWNQNAYSFLTFINENSDFFLAIFSVFSANKKLDEMALKNILAIRTKHKCVTKWIESKRFYGNFITPLWISQFITISALIRFATYLFYWSHRLISIQLLCIEYYEYDNFPLMTFKLMLWFSFIGFIIIHQSLVEKVKSRLKICLIIGIQ